MNGRGAIVGLCALCALLVSAFAAQGASAVTGTTAFTCQEKAGGGFTDAHCKTSGSGNFQHVAIPQDTKTEATITNETTGGAREPLGFKTTISGIPLVLAAGAINGKGPLENKVAASGEHYVRGTEMFPIEEVSVTEGAGCSQLAFGNGTGESGVGKEGSVILNVLTATTEGQGDAVKFSPASGEALASFAIQSCSNPTLNGTYTVVGSAKCIPNGATCKFTEAEVTAAGTLRLNSPSGPKVGISGTLTFKGRANSGEAYTPLSPTTVAT